MSRPREHWHSGAAPCGICGGWGEPGRGPSGTGEGALVFRQILRERWPPEPGEGEEAWFARVYRLFARGVWEPSPRTDLPYHAKGSIEPLEERPREESLEGLGRAGEPRPDRPEPGTLSEAARRALGGGEAARG
ncbi:MAG TPA: hypothetical protein VNO79_10955 [Actinomycetota bacterium]|nr:hypothetical protein [Actinomycetota bacterium]